MTQPDDLIANAKEVSFLIATGKTDEAVDRVRAEARQMSPFDFRQFVTLISQCGQKGQSTDLLLIIQPDGTTTVAIGENKKRAQWITDIKGSSVEMPFYPTPHPIRHFLPNAG